MKNIIELRTALCEIFDQLKAKKMKMPVAKELVNTAGKIIHSVKLELDYAALRKETPIVEFLGGDETPSLRAKSPLQLPGTEQE